MPMFARSLFVVAAIAAVAVYVPGIANSYLSAGRSEGSANGAETATVEPVSTARYTGNRGVTLETDAAGHFSGLFTINGRKQKGMIDTGASMVAINVSMAERLGIARKELDFRYAV